MSKKQMHIRASERLQAQLAALCTGGATITEVVSVAVDRMYKEKEIKMFNKMVQLAEGLPQLRSGQSRGYSLSVWYGDAETGEASYVIDYDEDGTPACVQEVGTYNEWRP